MRPDLHLTPPGGWMNDPLGLTYRGGLYHAFYQAVPDDVVWRPWCHWGHATSPDLVAWTHHPVALAPAADEVGCWSGDLVVPDDGDPLLLYTSVREPDLDLGAVRVARPTDASWTTWEPGEVVVPAPDGAAVFRDPTVFRDGDRWRMLVGGGLRDGSAAVHTYVSSDLRSWTADGVLARGPSAGPGLRRGWECPHLLLLGDVAVLVVSVWADGTTGHVAAGIGSYADGRFEAARWQRLTWGAPYAPTAFRDADGRWCLVFWLRGVGDPAAGWAGAMSVPYRVDLVPDPMGFDTPLVRLTPHPVVADRFRVGRDGGEDGGQGTEQTGADAEDLAVLVDGAVTEILGPDMLLGLRSDTLRP